jgi:hypothetical protein
VAILSSSMEMTNHNKIVIDSIFNLLKQSGYTLHEEEKKLEITIEHSEPNLPFFFIQQEPKKKTLIIEITGSPWNIITELSFRYLKELGVTFRRVDVYSMYDNEKLFEIEGMVFPNILFTIQQRLQDRDMFNQDIKLVFHISTLSVGKKTPTDPKPILKRPKIPIRGLKTRGIKPMISPVMFKRSKLSQLAKRDIPEPEPVYVTPPKPEIPEEYNLPILDELEEDERTILKEILKRPKKKVQSNHIAKHTNLEQEVIRDVLRELVNKGLLKVTSGWYVLKKQVMDGEENDEEEEKTTSRRKKKSSKRGTKKSSKRTRKRKQI